MDDNKVGMEAFLQLARNAGSLLVIGTALIPISGFVVFHTNLARYTNLYSFDVKVNFYVVAGVSMWIASALIIALSWGGSRFGETAGDHSTKLLANMPLWVQVGFLLAFVLIGLVILFVWFPAILLFVSVSGGIWVIVVWAGMSSELVKFEENESKFISLLEILLNPFKVIRTILASPFTMTTVFLVLAFIFYVVVVGSTYGQLVYNSISSSIGGGQPASVSIVFKSETDLRNLRLTGSRTQTADVCLLAELNNGYLVFDPTSSPSRR